MSALPARRRILVLDRDQMALDLLCRRFEGRHAVVGVRDGAEALVEARSKDFDLILLDLEMAGPNGSDLVCGLASLPAGAPILVISGHPAAAQVARRLGAADWIEKPYDLRDLEGKVDRLLASARSGSPSLDLANPDPRFHGVRFFGDAGEGLEAVADFAAGGLARGEAVALIVTPPHRTAVSWMLKERGEDPGRIEWLDVHRVLARVLVQGEPDERAFRSLVEPLVADLAARPGVRGVRFYGEAVGVLAEGGQMPQACRLEELWNAFLRERPMALL